MWHIIAFTLKHNVGVCVDENTHWMQAHVNHKISTNNTIVYDFHFAFLACGHRYPYFSTSHSQVFVQCLHQHHPLWDIAKKLDIFVRCLHPHHPLWDVAKKLDTDGESGDGGQIFDEYSSCGVYIHIMICGM